MQRKPTDSPGTAGGFDYYFSTKTAKQSLTTARSAGEMKSLSKSIELWCKIEMFKPKFTQERTMLYGK